jgi:hypothetical protein
VPRERGPIGKHPLLGWRGLLLVLVGLFIGVPFVRGLLGVSDAPPSTTPAPSVAGVPSAPLTSAVPSVAPATAAPAPSVGAASGPPGALDEFTATQLCEAAALNEINATTVDRSVLALAKVFADVPTQRMRVWNEMTYTKDGTQYTIQYECQIQMQDEWRRGVVLEVQITEDSP